MERSQALDTDIVSADMSSVYTKESERLVRLKVSCNSDADA